MSYFLEALGKYAVFSGRARRSEYWFFFLITMLIAIALISVGLGVANATGGPPTLAEYLADLWTLVFFLPNLAVSVRRLHDLGKSGWWMLLSFVPFGSLILLFMFCGDSEPGTNIYGPNPKEVAAPSF